MDKRKLNIEKQLIFIDDSGDPGFNKTSSRNFVIASAVFVNSDVATKINNAISDFRKFLKWHNETEFKFSKTNKKIVEQFLRIVSNYDFQIYSVYIDKNDFSSLLPLIDKNKLYDWTIAELLKIIPLDNAYIKIDGRAEKKNKVSLVAYLRKEINKDGQKIKQIKLEDSTKDNLIQLADLVAGAINRSLQPQKTDSIKYIKILNKKIIKIKKIKIR